MCFFAFFGAKIWPAAAGTGELARDLRDQTPMLPPSMLRDTDARGTDPGHAAAACCSSSSRGARHGQ